MKTLKTLAYIMYLVSCCALGLITRKYVTDNELYGLLFCTIGSLILWIIWMYIIPQISQRISSGNRR